MFPAERWIWCYNNTLSVHRNVKFSLCIVIPFRILCHFVNLEFTGCVCECNVYNFTNWHCKFCIYTHLGNKKLIILKWYLKPAITITHSGDWSQPGFSAGFPVKHKHKLTQGRFKQKTSTGSMKFITPGIKINLFKLFLMVLE